MPKVMKYLPIVSAIAVFSIALCLAAPVPKGADDVPSYFPTKVGTRWIYDSEQFGGFEVVISEAKEKDGMTTVKVVEVKQDGTEEPWRTVAVSKKGLSFVSLDTFVYKTPLEWLRLPAKVGTEWKVDTLFTYGENRWAPVSGTMKIVEIEELETPGGTFQTVRVEGHLEGTSKRTEVCWFAPKIGLVKWIHGGHVFVLKAFAPAK
jgi:hypothetical protein